MDSIKLSDQARKDIQRLKKEDVKLVGRALVLIGEILASPFEGTGKPEALKGDLKGWWSRRIDQRPRIIYRIKAGQLEIASLYGHYGDK